MIGYTSGVTRVLALALIVTGCANQRAKQAEPASSSPEAPAAPPPAPASAAPAPADVSAKDQARTQGMLGPTDTDAFGPIEGEGGADTKDGARRRDAAATTGGPAMIGALRTSITLGIPTLAGGVDGRTVKAALAKRMSELEACYQAGRDRDPALMGELSISFTVQPDGRLAAVSSSSKTIKDKALDACIAGVVTATKLDAPLGKTAIRGSMLLTLR